MSPWVVWVLGVVLLFAPQVLDWPQPVRTGSVLLGLLCLLLARPIARWVTARVAR